MTSTGPSAHAVRVVGVSVHYGAVRALTEVDLTVDRGSRLAIVGDNGAGKSTLVEVLVGVRDPDAGQVQRPTRAVAFVPQRTAVPDTLPVSVRDVVEIGAWGRGPWRPLGRDGRRAVDAALERVGAAGFASAPFSSLSGGQRQRVLLAQGLVRRAELLVLDEPTTGLDAESSTRIRDVLREEAEGGVAVVCVSHDPAMIADADRLVGLAGGVLVSDSARGSRV